MALFCLRPNPSPSFPLSLPPSASVRHSPASGSTRLSLLHVSRYYLRGLQPRCLLMCQGRAARYKSLDDYNYDEEEEGFSDSELLSDDLLESEDELDDDSEFDVNKDNKKLRKDHNRRQPISTYGKKDDLIIDIDGDGDGDGDDDDEGDDNNVRKKKTTSKVGASSKKDLMDMGSIGEVTVIKF